MSITLNARTETVVLYQDDDMHRINDLSAAVMAAIAHRETARARRDELRERLADAPVSMGEESPLTELDELVEKAEEAATVAAEAHDAFVNEAADRAAKVKVRALPRKPWRSLKLKHPMRMVTTFQVVKDAEGNETSVPVENPHDEDVVHGFNIETMADDLVPVAVDELGQFATPADRDAFLDGLSDPDFSRIYSMAILLNSVGARAPKAGASSLLGLTGAEISTLRARSA